MRNSTDIGKIIKDKRTARKITQTHLAEKLGIHKSTLSKYEKGLRNIPMDELPAIASALGMGIKELLLEEGKAETPKMKIREIPVVSQISAGVPVYSEESIIESTYVDESMMKDGMEYFGLKVEGDSMDKEFRPGDVVIIEKSNQIESGQVGVVQVNGYNATLKRVKYLNDSILLMPESNNSEHEPQIYNANDEVAIIGRVVGLNRKY